LRPARIPGAEEKHLGLDHRSGFYLQQVRIDSGLTALLRVQHSA
jgi:hypothetical protein